MKVTPREGTIPALWEIAVKIGCKGIKVMKRSGAVVLWFAPATETEPCQLRWAVNKPEWATDIIYPLYSSDRGRRPAWHNVAALDMPIVLYETLLHHSCLPPEKHVD